MTTSCWRLDILSNEIMEKFASKELQNFKLSTKIEQGRSEETDGMCEQQQIYIGPQVL